jgi:hypothetical protein
MAGGIERQFEVDGGGYSTRKECAYQGDYHLCADVLRRFVFVGYVTCLYPQHVPNLTTISIEKFSGFLDHQTGKTDFP